MQALEDAGDKNALESINLIFNYKNPISDLNENGNLECEMSSNQLQELEHEYGQTYQVLKQQLDNLLQSQVDALEKAKEGFASSEKIQKIVQDMERANGILQNVKQDIPELEELRELIKYEEQLVVAQNEFQMFASANDVSKSKIEILYNDISKIQSVFDAFKEYYQWKLHLLQKMEEHDGRYDGVPKKLVPVFECIAEFGEKIKAEIQNSIRNCIEIAQCDPNLMKEIFNVATQFETLIQSVAVQDIDFVCMTQVQCAAKNRIQGLLEEEQIESIGDFLAAATNLIIDLSVIKSDVAPCCTTLSIVDIFVATYNSYLEQKIPSLIEERESITIAEKLQVIEWIEYYNTEVAEHSITTSSSLQTLLDNFLRTYSEHVKDQLRNWIRNIWLRDEPPSALHGTTALITSMPKDVLGLVNSQIAVAKERLSGNALVSITVDCLSILLEMENELHKAKSKIDSPIEVLCSLINDTNMIQEKCRDSLLLVQEKLNDIQQETVLSHIDAVSGGMVKLIVKVCAVLANSVIHELEEDVLNLWFTQSWESGDSGVENLLATFEDYFTDLELWIEGSFFFPRIVKECMIGSCETYQAKFLQCTRKFKNPKVAANQVRTDYESFAACFVNYSSKLRRTGLRTKESIEENFSSLRHIEQLLTLSVHDVSNAQQTLKQHHFDEKLVDKCFSLRCDISKSLAEELTGRTSESTKPFEKILRTNILKRTDSSERTNKPNRFSNLKRFTPNKPSFKYKEKFTESSLNLFATPKTLPKTYSAPVMIPNEENFKSPEVINFDEFIKDI